MKVYTLHLDLLSPLAVNRRAGEENIILLPPKAAKGLGVTTVTLRGSHLLAGETPIGYADWEFSSDEGVLYLTLDESLPFNVRQSLLAALKRGTRASIDIKEDVDKKSGKEEAQKNTSEVAPASEEPSDGELHGGENASSEVEGSPNTAEDGEDEAEISESPSEAGSGKGEDEQGGSSSSDAGQGSSANNSGANPGSQGGESGGADEQGGKSASGVVEGEAGAGDMGSPLEAVAREILNKFIKHNIYSKNDLPTVRSMIERKLNKLLEASKSYIAAVERGEPDLIPKVQEAIKEEFSTTIYENVVEGVINDIIKKMLSELTEALKLENVIDVIKESFRRDFNQAYKSTHTKWTLNVIKALSSMRKEDLKRAQKLLNKLLESIDGEEASPRLNIKRAYVKMATYRNPYNEFKEELGADKFVFVADTSASMNGFLPLAGFVYELAKSDKRVVAILTNNNWPYAFIKNGQEIILDHVDNPKQAWRKIIKDIKPVKGININDLDGLEVWEDVLKLTPKCQWVLANNYACTYTPPKVDKDLQWRNCKHYVGVGSVSDVLDLLELNFIKGKWRNKDI